MKQLTIDIPEGHEIDVQASDLSKGIVKFKKLDLTYDSIYNKLFNGESKSDHFILDGDEGISKCVSRSYHTNKSTIKSCAIVSSTREQIKSLLALNKLCNIAKYLNDGWLPTNINAKFFIGYRSPRLGELQVFKHETVLYSCVYFKSKELAEQAIDILGEEEICKALTLNH